CSIVDRSCSPGRGSNRQTSRDRKGASVRRWENRSLTIAARWIEFHPPINIILLMNRPKSASITDGKSRAGARAFFHAMGLHDDDIYKPWVGIASTWNEATPCNTTLDRQAKAAK